MTLTAVLGLQPLTSALGLQLPHSNSRTGVSLSINQSYLLLCTFYPSGGTICGVV